MQLGLDSYSFHLRLGRHGDFAPQEPADLGWFIEKTAELGFDGVQLDPAHIESTDEGYLGATRNLLQKHGLYVEFGSAGVDPIRLIRDLKAASFLGAPILRTFVGYDPRLPKAERERLLAQAQQNLRQVASYAQRYGVRIAVENHADVSVKELKELIGMVDSPWVGVLLDTANNLAFGEDSLYAARELAPYTLATHLKDSPVTAGLAPQEVSSVPLGRGGVPLREIVRILQEEAGLERFTIECVTGAGEAPEADLLELEEARVRESLEYARNVLGIR